MYIKIEQICTEQSLFTTSKMSLEMEGDIQIPQIYIYGRCTDGVTFRSYVAENHKLAICSSCSLNCCAWCDRSVTLSTISWMAAVFG